MPNWQLGFHEYSQIEFRPFIRIKILLKAQQDFFLISVLVLTKKTDCILSLVKDSNQRGSLSLVYNSAQWSVIKMVMNLLAFEGERPGTWVNLKVNMLVEDDFNWTDKAAMGATQTPEVWRTCKVFVCLSLLQRPHRRGPHPPEVRYSTGED